MTGSITARIFEIGHWPLTPWVPFLNLFTSRKIIFTNLLTSCHFPRNKAAWYCFVKINCLFLPDVIAKKLILVIIKFWYKLENILLHTYTTLNLIVKRSRQFNIISKHLYISKTHNYEKELLSNKVYFGQLN